MSETVNGVPLQKALTLAGKLLPDMKRSEVAIPAPEAGEGYWVGAPSAVESDGYIYLAYRLRHPVELGRGQGVAIAKSRNGIDFESVDLIPKEAMDAESLERPTLVRVDDDVWRLYLSCATIGTKHWRVEMIEARRPEDFDPANRRLVLPGSKKWAVKDTVIQKNNSKWELWATFHPLDIRNEEDRMYSRYATSGDGLTWRWAPGFTLAPRSGKWDSRGERLSAIHRAKDFVLGFYDGRASAAENYEERTGVAVGMRPGRLQAVGDTPFAESPTHRALRYFDLLPLKDGSYRTYYEIATEDDSHELRTEHIVL